jgi:hypothetical protein
MPNARPMHLRPFFHHAILDVDDQLAARGKRR